MLSIDQMRGDYYDRFRPELTRGLGRLIERGAFFTDAHHDHAITETAPGHATLLSGRFPRNTGIVRNSAGVVSLDWPLHGSPDSGAAPFRFRGTTLADWMQAADRATRVLSVSAKDRSAILMVGREKHPVFWYANNGTFTNSTWYGPALPEWVEAFNRRRLAHAWAGTQWDVLPGGVYSESDSVPQEHRGVDYTFPHRFSADPDAAARQLRRTPMMDELTLALAWAGVRELDLGGGNRTDLLAISLSATDYVGHDYGPASREQHDNLRRLDRVLGGFLDSLFALRDSTRIVFAISADHGVTPIPELSGSRKVDQRPAVRAARNLVRQRGGDPAAVVFDEGAIFVNPARLGPDTATGPIADAFLDAARGIAGIVRAERFSAVSAARNPDEVTRRWQQMFSGADAPVAVLTIAPGNGWASSTSTANHGSPHRADSHVPLVLVGAPFTPGRIARFVRTVDLAPTLAAALGIRPLETLDGVVLRDALKR